jgi:hypothetical protein
LYRVISDFKKGFLPRTNVVRHERAHLVTDCHSILVRCRKHFFQLLNVHGVNDIRPRDIHTAEPLVPEPSAFEFAIAIEKLKDTDHQEFIKPQQKRLKQVAEQFALRSIHLLIIFRIRRNCLRNGRSRSLYLFIRRVTEQTVSN